MLIDGPIFVPGISTVSIYLGENNVTIECPVCAYPPSTTIHVKWTKPQHSGQTNTHLSGTSLIINQVRKEDLGNYTCELKQSPLSGSFTILIAQTVATAWKGWYVSTKLSGLHCMVIFFMKVLRVMVRVICGTGMFVIKSEVTTAGDITVKS